MRPISNILFETLVTNGWPEHRQAEGHAVLLKRDIQSGLVVTSLGLLLTDMLALLAIAMLLQLMTVSLVLKWRPHIYIEQEAATPLRLGATLKLTWGAVSHLTRPLLALAGLGFSIGLPAAALGSVLPFALQHAYPHIEVDAWVVAMFSMVRTVISVALMYWLRYQLKAQADAGVDRSGMYAAMLQFNG